MAKTVIIGKWIEKESREIRQCPSYYAADWETLQTKPGEYDARLTFEGGYLIPMPYWLLVSIEADRTGGATYSGFGGVNFAKNDLPLEPKPYHIQTYAYSIKRLVEEGKLVLAPGFDWLLDEIAWKSPKAPKTWEEVNRLAA